MATKTILIDDLDGTEAFRTLRWSFDGHTYEIDLSREHLEAFKHGLGPWIDASREVSKFANKGGEAKRATGREATRIREWARLNGWPDVKDLGPIPQEIATAYRVYKQGRSAATPAA